MKVYAIIQARMSSQRFPGKVLYNVNGKPLLGFMIERVKLSKFLKNKNIIIGTSVAIADVNIENFSQNIKVISYRGDLDNVAKRFKDIIEENNIDSFVRLSGDSPLIDPKIIDRAIEIFVEGDYDLVTNVFPRSFPKGQSVEVIRSSAFLRAYSQMKSADYCEHITKHFYGNNSGYKIHNFESGVKNAVVQLSVDTKEDMELFEKMVAKMDKPHWEYGWQELLQLRSNILTGVKQ